MIKHDSQECQSQRGSVVNLSRCQKVQNSAQWFTREDDKIREFSKNNNVATARKGRCCGSQIGSNPRPIKRENAMFTNEENTILVQAAAIIESKMRTASALSSADLARAACVNRLVHKEHEVFAILMLDSQHRLIEFVELFRGSIDSASVYPREVVKSVLEYNAASVIFAHNHPSGIAEPSQADRRITERVSQALALIDVNVLDHFVIGVGETVSFAERGWL